MPRSATVLKFQVDVAVPTRRKQSAPMTREEVMALVRDDDTDPVPTSSRDLLVQLLAEYADELEERSRVLCERQAKDSRSKIRNKDWVSLRHAMHRARHVRWDLMQAETTGPRLLAEA